jgi:hypothetical protein
MSTLHVDAKPGPVESGVPGSASDARSIAVGVPANNNIEQIHTEAAEASGSAEAAERRDGDVEKRRGSHGVVSIASIGHEDILIVRQTGD